jgi:hypothetical protein
MKKKSGIWKNMLALMLGASMAVAPMVSAAGETLTVHAEELQNISSETPASDETSASEETLISDGTSTSKETLTSDETSASEETLTSDGTSTSEETLTSDETSASEETLISDGTSTSEETLTSDGTSTSEETSVVNGKSASNETADTAAAVKGVMVYASGSNLLEIPEEDAKALQTTLGKTNEFNADDFKIIGIPQKSNTDYKERVWDAIASIAAQSTEESTSVFYYSGHGNYSADGTSYLALEGVNNIPASDLRDHLKTIKGKVIIFIDACYSGGMEMPTSDMDPFLESFIGTFYETGDEVMAAESGNTSASTKFYFISAASSRETAYQESNGLGGELTASVCHALGYDRRIDSYNVYAADTSSLSEGSNRSGYKGDGKITMTELSEYYGRVALTSTPVVYPEQDDTVLFTYEPDAGIPATFRSWITKSENNVKVSSKGKITLNVTVENLTGEKISLGAAVYSLDDRRYIYTAYTNCKNYTDWGRNVVFDAYETNTFDVTITSQSFLNVGDVEYNPFCLKIYDYGNGNGEEGTTIRSYNALSFYTSESKGTNRGEIDKTALKFSKPVQLTRTTADESMVVYKTSSSLPVEIYYDDDTENRETNAACRLYLYAYDVTVTNAADGTCSLPDGIHVDAQDAGKLLDANGNAYDLSSVQKKTFVNNVRPTHSRNTDDKRGSVYTYVMDTTSLELNHYYILEAVCRYDDKSTKQVYTVIQRTSGTEADTYQIPWYRYDKNSVMADQPDRTGIPTGSDWEEAVTQDDRTVKGATVKLKKKLDDAANGHYIHTILKWQKNTAKDGEEDQWVDMKEDETFEEGGEYISVVQIDIADSYNAVFTTDTSFGFYGHKIVGDVVLKSNKQVVLSIKHQFLSATHTQTDDIVSMYWADTFETNRTEIPVGTELKWGDKVVLAADKGYDFEVEGGLKRTKKKINGYSVWVVTNYVKTVEDPYGKIEVSAYETDGVGCSCGKVLLQWKTHPASQGVDDDDSEESGGSGSGSQGDTSGSAASEETMVVSESAAQNNGAALTANVVALTNDAGETADTDNASAAAEQVSEKRGGATSGTGDEGHLELWLLLSVGSAAALTATTKRKRENHRM